MAEIKQVLVPDIGDYKDVSVIEVMVKVGDTVNAEDTLLTLETDKAAMDVPSPYSGVVRELHVELGNKVSQGTLILVLECADTAAPVTSGDVSPHSIKSADVSAHSIPVAAAVSAPAALTPPPPHYQAGNPLLP